MYMDRIVVGTAVLLIMCAVADASDGHKSQGDTALDWRLVWSDEFNKDGQPDPRNWTNESGFVRNKELQWYQAENAWCERGLLVIEARREKKENPGFHSLSRDWRSEREYAEYTSASLRTKGLHNWQFGRFEMRARIDSRSGLWPAFWTMGIKGEWPHCGEIDIMEFYRGILLANVAWGSQRRWVPHWDSVRLPIARLDSDWPDEFHVWRMDWDRESIKLHLDERLLNATHLNETVNEDWQAKNPFHQPHFVLLNLAVGGTNGGDPRSTGFANCVDLVGWGGGGGGRVGVGGCGGGV